MAENPIKVKFSPAGFAYVDRQAARWSRSRSQVVRMMLSWAAANRVDPMSLSFDPDPSWNSVTFRPDAHVKGVLDSLVAGSGESVSVVVRGLLKAASDPVSGMRDEDWTSPSVTDDSE